MNPAERKQKQAHLKTLLTEKSGVVLSEIGGLGGLGISLLGGGLLLHEHTTPEGLIAPGVLTVLFGAYSLIVDRIRRTDNKGIAILQKELSHPAK